MEFLEAKVRGICEWEALSDEVTRTAAYAGMRMEEIKAEAGE
jgi:hypothetical protein